MHHLFSDKELFFAENLDLKLEPYVLDTHKFMNIFKAKCKIFNFRKSEELRLAN